ncbi:sensor histidine kinase, putative [Microseira wollei NIES-4236]|uniref:Sensor histidine kinase, putative n=1 Tax=Microseira wollei NIES-4236 TaxID=2530354 RepID=A0AAV3XE89_9CYAN|nr:sensor histidine kinase, putative [Microseira wollei NIES-4236]
MVSASITDEIDPVLTLYQNQIKRGDEVRKTSASVTQILFYPEEIMQVWSNLISTGITQRNKGYPKNRWERKLESKVETGFLATPLRQSCSNAIQAMNYQGELGISVCQNDEYVVVEITDSGVGIPPEIQHRIFYYQTRWRR